MTDTLSPEERSARMRLVRSKDTKLELAVRKLCRELGFTGYRLHRKDLPGKPDVAFIGKRKAIFVHGCFWHGHTCRMGSRRPKSNQEYWLPKIGKNQERDAKNLSDLDSMHWSVLSIWECEIQDRQTVRGRLNNFLEVR